MSGFELFDRLKHSLKYHLKHSLPGRLRLTLTRSQQNSSATHDSARSAATFDFGLDAGLADGARLSASAATPGAHGAATPHCGASPAYVTARQPVGERDRYIGGYPADFSAEEARFAEELRARFTMTRGAFPPLYAQTLLGDGADGALADPRLAPLSAASERALIKRVFRVAHCRATPVEAAVRQKDLCEVPAHLTSH